MRDDRVARGSRGEGAHQPRRLRRYLVAGLALVLYVMPVGSTHAASGGAGFGRSGHRPGSHKQSSARSAQNNPLTGRAVWIWYVSQANGGNVGSIIATARRHGIHDLIIKAGDGGDVWSQFSSGLVSRLHGAGIRACAWQFVYGDSPIAEARVGATAVHRGADCLMIDAEGQYEGKYAQAQSYIRTLRRLIGNGFPLALAGLPYVDYHPAFPYSVFLGPGGAQYNEPQMYWSAIGTSVDEVYNHTYTYNRPYGRSTVALGDVTSNPPASEIYRFRRLSKAYGETGDAFWEWSQTPSSAWNAISRRISWLTNYTPSSAWPVMSQGWAGDLVVWAQEHLYSAGQRISIGGNFDSQTLRAVRRFQASHGLSADGVIGPATWHTLLRYPAVRVSWTSSGAHVASALPGTLAMPLPKSAHLRDKREEIPWNLGAH